MKRVGYGRVSTAGQARNGTSLAEQKKQLMAAGVAEEDIYLDAYTGTKMHRPQFDACMAALEPDDEFVVCKLDRFARTVTEGTGIVRDLVERGFRVNVLNMGIADNTPMGKMMVTVMLAFAEYERDMIVERTQSARRRGVKLTQRTQRGAPASRLTRNCSVTWCGARWQARSPPLLLPANWG